MNAMPAPAVPTHCPLANCSYRSSGKCKIKQTNQELAVRRGTKEAGERHQQQIQ
jgi:hypothetical protein